MMRTGGCCFSITRIWTEEVWVRSREPRVVSRRRPGRGRSGGGQVERVLRVAGRVVGGGVQRVETMVFVLDLGAVGDDEADLAEAADDVLGHLGQRVELAQGAAAAGQGEIGGFLGQGGLEFQFAAALGQGGFELDLGGVDGLAGGGLLFLGQGARVASSGR